MNFLEINFKIYLFLISAPYDLWFLKKLSSTQTYSSFAHNFHHKTDYTFIITHHLPL